MLKKTTSMIWLVAILSAIFISCKKEDLTVGSKFQDEEGTYSFTNLTQDELDISFSTLLKKESLTTLNESEIMVGSQKGNTVADVDVNSFVEIKLSEENPDFGTNPVCDSVIFFLSFLDNEPGNRFIQGTGVTEVIIKELSEVIVTDSAYASSKGFATEDISLGSRTFNGGIDGDGTQVELDQSFGDKLISLSQNKTFEEFENSLKGLALLSGSASTMISSFNPADNNTLVRVYYSNDEGVSNEYDFNLGDDLDEHIQVVSNTVGSYAGLVAENDIISANLTGNKTALSSGTGIHTLIHFDDLNEILDTLNDVTVNRAVFTLKVEPSIYTDITGEAPLAFNIVESDENGQAILDSLGDEQILIPHLNIVTGGGTGLFILDKTELTYTVDLTYYFQQVALKERELNSLLLSTDIDIAGVSYNARFRETTLAVDDIEFQLVYSKL